MDKLNQSFPDPSEFKNEGEFTYAAKVSAIFKKTVAEILQWFETQQRASEYLEKKKKGDIDNNFDIGR